MTFKLEEPIDQTLPAWDLYIFRRNVVLDYVNLMTFLHARPLLTPLISILIETTEQGKCMRNCVLCGGDITPDKGFGGVVILEAEATREAFISPLCMPCACQDLDIIVTKASDTISKAYFQDTLQPDTQHDIGKFH